jgi:hypothetical protein
LLEQRFCLNQNWKKKCFSFKLFVGCNSFMARKPRALTVKGGMPSKKERQRYKSLKGQRKQVLKKPSTASISRAKRMRSKFERLAVEAKNKGNTLEFVFWNLKALRDGRIDESQTL